MEQRSQDFQERARRQELMDRELSSVRLKLGEDHVSTNEGKNFESIVLADQVLKDRRYLITKHYFSENADGTFQTWRDLLYMEEGIFSDVYEEIDLLASQAGVELWLFQDKFCCWQLLSWHHGDLGFAWHIKCTSKQIYTISRLTTEVCPSFLPQGIEKQYSSDLPLLLQWREFDFIYQELRKKGLITEVPNMIIPENYGESLHSFAVAILCKARDLLEFPRSTNFDKSSWTITATIGV